MLRMIFATIFVGVAAASAASAERRVALVFGSDDYLSARKLTNAVSDARLIGSVLSGLDFEVRVETDRSLAQMRLDLAAFRQDGAGSDVALVFFAGHGAEIDGANRLLPVDTDAATLKDLERTTLPLEEVRAAVNATASTGLVMLDACRNDPFGAAGVAGRGAQALKPAVAAEVRTGLGRVGEATNLLFAFSAAPGRTAADGADGHSPFAAALAEHLGAKGLEIRSVMTLVQQDVYDRSRGAQLPYVESGLPKLFFAAQSRDPLPERERLLLAMADVTPEIRGDVERVASDAEMPLAPLYAALIDAPDEPLTAEQRGARLREAAQSFVAVRKQMQTMASVDPQVAALRDEAEAQLALGAFATARARLAEAAAIDERSRDALRANYADRTLSLAATVSLSAGTATAGLNYDQAIADYRRAITLFDEAGDGKLSGEQADRRLTILQALGDLYTKVGNVGAAAATFEVLQQRADERAAEAPGDPSIRYDVAASHIKLANAQIAKGDRDAAFSQFETARDLLQAIETETKGARPSWTASLARVHDDLGSLLMTRGDLHGADAAFRAGLKLKEALSQANSGDLVLKRDLTVTYDELGDLWRTTGDFSGARAAYEAGLKIRQDLAQALPDEAERQRDLSISHDKLGDVLRDMDEPEAAIRAYRTSKTIMATLARRDPGDARLRRDVSLSDSKIGNALRDQGDLEGALAAYDDVLDTATAMAELDPGNAEWQRDLSVSLEKVADILLKRNEPRGALKRYMTSYAIMSRLVASEPGNTEWQRDISITLAEIANIRLAGGDRKGARAAFTESLDIRQSLAESDPGNALWQRDLMLAYADYARVAPDPGQMLRRALDLARALDDAGRLPENQKPIIDILERRLARSGRASK